ncbi:hypothetical protein PUN28_001226 [Cardiocondyla obscurior]|uniref:Uncharacterized protein n=1 Tax=Cardiocondyla obscurior TaxID=286306 RepID=A0AAW2H3W0_9HYME
MKGAIFFFVFAFIVVLISPMAFAGPVAKAAAEAKPEAVAEAAAEAMPEASAKPVAIKWLQFFHRLKPLCLYLLRSCIGRIVVRVETQLFHRTCYLLLTFYMT